MIKYFYFLLIISLLSCNQNKSNLISAHDFDEMIKLDKSSIIIDVRTPEEFNKGHLRNSLNVNWFDNNFDDNIDIFSKDLSVFVYCLSGGRSAKANEKIRSLGFKNVYELDGGILEWRKNKLPKEEILEYEGKVLELLPQASFKILLDNGHEVKAVISGRLRKNRIRILTGDRIKVAISPYDLTRGRVTFRL